MLLAGDPYVSQNDKPGFLSDDELKKLLVEASVDKYWLGFN